MWPFAATSLDVSVGVAGDWWNTGSLTAPSRVVADATFNVDAPTGVTVTGSPNSQNALGGTAGFNCWGKAVDPTFPVSGVVMTAANPTIDPTQYNIFAGFGYLPTQSSGMTASTGVPGRQLMGGGGLHRRLVPGHRQAERNHSQGRTEFRECDRPGFPCAGATAIPVRRLPVLPADQVQPGRAGRGRLSRRPIHGLRPFRYVLYGQGGGPEPDGSIWVPVLVSHWEMSISFTYDATSMKKTWQPAPRASNSTRARRGSVRWELATSAQCSRSPRGRAFLGADGRLGVRGARQAHGAARG